MKSIKIISNGKYLPKNKTYNKELEAKLDLEEGYILKRTGIKNRYYIKDESLEEMASYAAIDAIEKGKIDKNQIDMIIVASASTNKIMPGISYLVQKRLNIKNCMCLDILAGCNGYINAFDIVRNYIAIGKVNTALIIGVDILSKIILNDDISTSIILSDGAGATIIQGLSENKKYYSIIKSIGEQSDILTYDIFSKLKMNGSKIYRYAITDTIDKIEKLLKQSNEILEDIKYIIPHQSNLKIIKGIANRINLPLEKFYINIENIGNTFCASIPIALLELQEKNLISKGDLLMLVGYGGGLNTGCILLEI